METNQVGTLKECISQLNTQQKNAFSQENILDLLYQRSNFYDQILLELWAEFGFAQREDLALLAVGGYGRQEMFPLSDLDILVLAENEVDEATHAQLNKLFNLLWDAKLQVGATVRTVAECIEIGKKEISVATNMYESRYLTGNKLLWQNLMEQLYQDDFWAIEDFFQAKMAEKNDRYARYHNTSYNLEPDLKHSPGGLRDLHLISWIMLRNYGIHDLETLLNRGLLYSEEYQTLSQAQAVLFRMRFALHMQLKRYDNRLRFDRQLKLSEQLGYQGEGNQPVEAMMKDFFQATQAISQLSQLLLNSFEQEVLKPQNIGEKQPLDQHFIQQNGVIYTENYRCFSQEPYSILDLFYHLTQYPNAKVRATTLRHLRIALQKLKQPLCELAQARSRFIQIFQQLNMVARAVVPMHQLGVLTAYFPAWRGIVGLMQFDLFHIYTVDEHTIRVMLKLESFLDSQTQSSHPLCYEKFSQCDHRTLVYLAALLHDIAKGREGDHAEVGAVDMYDFAILHGFSEVQAQQMAWLVREHLTMSITAQRRDIHDPNVVKTFAEIVENQTALSDLVCLTVADICATNETLWNDWKRTLLSQLYQFTSQQLVAKLDYQKEAENNRLEAVELMKFALTAEQRKRLQTYWQPCPASYFLRNKPKQLVWHALSLLKQQNLPLVLVGNEYARGATEIFIHCEDQNQLFARIAQELSQKKISIHDAQIITSENGLVYDSFIVTESNGQALNEIRCEQIQQSLIKVLLDPASKTFKAIKKPIKHQTFKRKTKVRFLANSPPNQTAFELFTLDREGLLAQLSHIFNQLELVLINAKITTIGERVEDFFVVSTLSHESLSEEQQHQLKQHILDELSH